MAQRSHGVGRAVVPAEEGTVTVRHEYSVAPRTIAIGTAIVLGSIVCLFILRAVLAPLILVILSIIIGEALRPAVDLLHRRGIPRAHAVLLVYAVLAAMAFLVFSYLLGPLLSQAGTLIHDLPGYADRARREVIHLQTVMRDAQIPGALADQVNSLVETIIRTLLALPQQIFNVFITLLVLAFLTFFWLTSTPQLGRLLLSITPPERHAVVLDILAEESRILGGWVRGVLINMALLGGLTAVALFVLKVPYALLLGVLTALTQLIPYVGPWISGVPAVALAYLTGGPVHAVQVAVVYIIVQEVASIVFVPLVMHGTIRLHPLLTTIALLVGAALFGVAGVVLSVPITAALQVPVSRLLIPVLHRHAYGGVSSVENGDEDDVGE